MLLRVDGTMAMDLTIGGSLREFVVQVLPQPQVLKPSIDEWI